MFGEFEGFKGDLGSSQKFVLGGLEGLLKKGMGKAGQQYARQGWGGRLHSPSVQSAIQRPWLEQGMETGRKALTDLHFKERQQKLAEDKWDQAYSVSEDERRRQRKIEMGGKVICTELHRQGLLSFSHIKADLKYLKLHVSRETHEDYLRWAIPFTGLMKKNKLITYLILPFVLCWSEYMMCIVYNKRFGIRAMFGALFQKMAMQIGKWYKNKLKKVEVI